ncbi:MAG: hypothetical protein RIQ72_373 [Candidatus Parcubacteria bacterium]|jgi:hypothetical protein
MIVKLTKINFIIFVIFLFCLSAMSFIADAATVSIPNSSGGSTVIPTNGSPLEGTDLYNPPAITQEQALNQDYSLGDTSLSDTPSDRTIEGILRYSSTFLGRLAPFIITLTLLTFLWGMFQMVRSGSEESRKEGRQIIVFGVVALFVMVSVWGLVNLLRRTTGLTGASTAPQGPGVPRFK